MNEYIVTRKSDGAVVCPSYSAEAPVEWNGMEFATHDHTTIVPAAGPVSPATGAVFSKLAYLRRFTQEERIAIRTAATQSPALADYLALLELAEEIDTRDADTIAAVHLLEQLGLLADGRALEILNG